MFKARTDMADERQLDVSKGLSDKIEGLSCREYKEGGVSITEIEVASPESGQAIGKPQGIYITLDLEKKWQQDNDLVIDMAHKLSRRLTPLLPRQGSILVVGLGNRYITADALGPLAVEKVIVTRHLRDQMPDIFGNLRDVCCIAPGVMGQTGMEVLELVQSVCHSVQPAAVIAIDALAARSLSRLGSSFQISTGGIIPGEGAGSRRFALSRQTLGVPVISIGVPTVTDAATMAYDLLGQHDRPTLADGDFLVSPSDIDLLMAKSAKAVGYSVNLALQGDMPISDMEQMLA